MKGPSRSLFLASRKLLVSRNLALYKKEHFKSHAPHVLTIPSRALSSSGRLYQSTTIEYKVIAVPEVSEVLEKSEILEESEAKASKIPELSETPFSSPTTIDSEPSTNFEISPSHDLGTFHIRNPQTAYIAIGSNIGNRINWIEKAVRWMKQPGEGITVQRTSSLWETEPMYVTDQGKFLNGVIEIETTLSATSLLLRLQRIEGILGREKFQEKGPRNIDLDILLYGNDSFNYPQLIIPHPLMLEREFVLRPLAELLPLKELDSSQPGKTTSDFLNDLPPSSPPMLSVSYLTADDRYDALKPLDPKKKTHIMGIVNVTPDSFSDGGKYLAPELFAPPITASKESLPQQPAESLEMPLPLRNLMAAFDSKLVARQTAIIDIGGQSTAPGAPEVTVEEETTRVIKVVKGIKKYLRAPQNKLISVDTYRASVAEAAIRMGAEIVNDISAGQLDPKMLSTVAGFGKTIILMHMRGTPETMQTLTNYEPHGLIPTIAHELLERVAAAEKAGIYKWRIILDPGIGFAKTADQNMEILRRLDELRSWPGLIGFPWLVGASRKGFIGRFTGVKVPGERIAGSVVAAVAAIQGGADILRVHDVRDSLQAAKMADALWRV